MHQFTNPDHRHRTRNKALHPRTHIGLDNSSSKHQGGNSRDKIGRKEEEAIRAKEEETDEQTSTSPSPTLTPGDPCPQNHCEPIWSRPSPPSPPSPELSLLSKGLKFAPKPPKANRFQLKQDLEDFRHRIRLREFFYGPEANDEKEIQGEKHMDTPKEQRCSH